MNLDFNFQLLRIRLVQNAGEFVVTFPRAYHTGFSHGMTLNNLRMLPIGSMTLTLFLSLGGNGVNIVNIVSASS